MVRAATTDDSPQAEKTPMRKAGVTPEAITAAGNSCLGMGNAIAELARNGFAAEARDLAEQLKLTSKSLRWLIREEREVTSDSRDQLDATSDVCTWMKAFLSEKPRTAMEILQVGEAAHFNKSQIFQARTILDLIIERKYGKQVWRLPNVS